MNSARLIPLKIEGIDTEKFDELCSSYVEPGAFTMAVPEGVEMLPLPKEAWKMHVTEAGELMVRDWYAPAVVLGWSTFIGDYSNYPDDEITATDLERHGIVAETINGRTVFKKIG